jgi:uncharacterized protein (TIGR03790 family)
MEEMISARTAVEVPLLVVAMLFGAGAGLRAQDGSNVLVVVNSANADSEKIAGRYVTARSIPADNVLRLKTSTDDEIDRRSFDIDIEVPIAEWISRRAAQDRILYIVLTKGIPLRIRGSGGLTGTTSSVDSELTLVYRKLLGAAVPAAGRVPNPYFQGDRPLSEAKPFSHEKNDVYLVTRLDGFTLDAVYRAIAGGVSPLSEGTVILDRKGGASGDIGGDGWLSAAADRLTAEGHGAQVLLDASATVLTGQKPVLGYYSWGSSDPAIKRRRLDLGFVPGSLAAMFVSTDGRTLQSPPESWNVGDWQNPKTFFAGSPQSLAGDLIEEGATGVAGHVAEPYLDAAIRPQILFPAYFRGFNLAESFYLANPFLSWQTFFVGDPLCKPFKGAFVPQSEASPELDPDTELPRFFSDRRLTTLAGFGVRRDVGQLMLKANSRLMHADLAGARDALEAVTVLVPELNAAHFVLAGIYEQLREYDKAVARYRKILVTTPTNVRSLNNLAYVLATRKHRLDEALPLARSAYELSRQNELVVDLGYAMIARKGTPASSLPFGIPAYNIAALRGQVSDTLGWIYHLLGDQERSAQLLAEAVAGDPDNGLIHVHLADVALAAGQTAKAKASLERALELDAALSEEDEVRTIQAALSK